MSQIYSHKKSLKKRLPFNPPLPPNEDKPPPPLTTDPDTLETLKGKYRNSKRNNTGSILPAIVLEEEEEDEDTNEDDDIADIFLQLSLGDSKKEKQQVQKQPSINDLKIL